MCYEEASEFVNTTQKLNIFNIPERRYFHSFSNSVITRLEIMNMQ